MAGDEDRDDADLEAALAGFRELVGDAGAAAAAAALSGLDAARPAAGGRLGDFELGRELGRGGMGVVFEAEQVSVPGRLVAVKVLSSAFASPSARARFAREVAAIGRLDHPNIVPILAADVQASTPFYAMKKIGGRSLREALRAREFAGDVRRVATIARDVARALQHAHDHGIVHRDVKPGNVLIDDDGRAMLVDFGLALALAEDSALTMTGDAIGTPDYMAPEQVDPRLGAVTARTDVYGLGALLYECLALRPAFVAATRHEVLVRIVAGDAQPLRRLDRAIPRDLETICASAMQVEPARRYATAGAFADDLEAFLDHRPIRARRPGWTRRGQLLLRRHRVAVTATALALAGFVAAAGYWGWIRPARTMGVLLASVDRAWQRLQDVEQRLDTRLAAERELLGKAPNTVLEHGLPALQLELQQLRAERLAFDRDLEFALEACAAFNPADPRGRGRHADFLARQLRELLAGGGVVLRRDQIERCERRLRNLAETPGHRALLEPTSQLVVRSPVAASVWLCPVEAAPDGRMLAVASTAATASELGATPVTASLREGNYVLRAQAPGFVDIELPLLLRRAAVQTDGEAAIELEFLRPEQIGDGFRQVHAGHGVVFDARTGNTSVVDRLVRHPGFLIAERELTKARLAAWRTAEPYLGPVPSTPPGPDQLVQKPLWNDITEILGRLNEREHAARTGFYVAVPTPEEWTRAARGADGRPYPWGWLHDWRFAQNYWSTIDDQHGLRPSRWPEQDLSPFLIHDLAGSLREVCLPERPLRQIGTKQFLLSGGSYLSTMPQSLRIASPEEFIVDERTVAASGTPRAQTLQNTQFAEDVGIRLVRRPLPACPTGPAQLSLPATLPAAAAAWHVTAVRGPLREDVEFDDCCEVTANRLVVRGYGGGFSPTLWVWHAIDIAGRDFTATFDLSVLSASGLQRALEVRFGTRPGFEMHDEFVACRIAKERWSLHIGAAQVAAAVPSLTGESLRLRLQGTAERLHATLVANGRDLGALAAPWPPSATPRWTYVGVLLPNLVSMQLEIETLEVESR